MHPEQPMAQAMHHEQPVAQAMHPMQPMAQAMHPEQPMDQAMHPEQPMDQAMHLEQPMDQAMHLEQPMDQAMHPEQPMDQAMPAGQHLFNSFEGGPRGQKRLRGCLQRRHYCWSLQHLQELWICQAACTCRQLSELSQSCLLSASQNIQSGIQSSCQLTISNHNHRRWCSRFECSSHSKPGRWVA